MKFVMEIIGLLIFGLLGAVNIRNVVINAIDNNWFLFGLSLMSTITVITYMLKYISRF